MEIKRFIFQLENIVEFARDDAADVPTLMKLTEQCLTQKLYLNTDNLEVPILREMLETVCGEITRRLDIAGIEDPTSPGNQERVAAILKDDLSLNIQGKVKKMIRRYFEDLWGEEMGQGADKRSPRTRALDGAAADDQSGDKTAAERAKTGQKDTEPDDHGLTQTLEGEHVEQEKRQGDPAGGSSAKVDSAKMTQALDEAKSETISKRSSMQEIGAEPKNKYLLLDAEPAGAGTAIGKVVTGHAAAHSAGEPSPDRMEPEEINRILQQTGQAGSREDFTTDFQSHQTRAAALSGSHMPAAMHQELIA